MGPFTRRDAEFSQEIEAHLAHEADQLIADGVPPDEARFRARRRFGNVTAARERHYESSRLLWWDQLRADARVVVRSLLRERGVMLVALLSLALGIGATTAIVSTVDSVLLRPLPYHDPERLVMVWEEMSALGFPTNTPAPANYLDWVARNQVFEGMAATLPARANLIGDGVPERVLGRRVTANFFGVLGVQPLLGRSFTDEEDRQGAPVVVISYALWQRRYAGDPAVIGRSVTMNDMPSTVIGVMPASFVFRDREMDFWAPISFTPAQRTLRGIHVLNVVARLGPGVELDTARQQMTGIAADMAREFRENEGVGIALVPIREDVFGDTRQQLIVLGVAAGCLLLLMSANLANLLMARAAAKRRELATRAALGATRPRLVVQLVSEGLIWSALGGVIGVGVAVAGLEVLNALIPVSLAENVAAQLDLGLLMTAVAISLATGVGFSVVPALGASRVSLNDVLKATGGGLGGGWGARSALITVQVAVTFALLIGAGLMLQSLANLRGVPVGFRTDGLMTANTPLPAARYDNERRALFYARVLQELQGVPGVVSAGFTSTLPFLSRGNTAGYRIEGRTTGPSEPGDALFRVITIDYLETLGATRLDGRLPDTRDRADSLPIAVINKSFADLYWPGESAVGRRIALANPTAPWTTIVGVVADIRENGYEVAQKPGIYMLSSQTGFPADNLVVRATGDPLTIVPGLRQVIARVDPEQPVAGLRSMEDIIDLAVVDRRQQSIILLAFATTALLLASVGIYGLVSFSVTVRRREVGLRTALGGSIGDVTRALVRHGLVLAVAGVAIGMTMSLAGTRIMEGLLFGVRPQDPATFAVITAVVLAISALACWLPARRAARMSPMMALRQD
jgi:putative ABC transport system permease protein